MKIKGIKKIKECLFSPLTWELGEGFYTANTVAAKYRNTTISTVNFSWVRNIHNFHFISFFLGECRRDDVIIPFSFKAQSPL